MKSLPGQGSLNVYSTIFLWNLLEERLNSTKNNSNISIYKYLEIINTQTCLEIFPV